MKEIPLTQGLVALVDDEDFEYLNQWKWYTGKSKNTSYALRTDRAFGTKKTLRMHRVIMNTTENMDVDHRDRNGLNNQKSNLRNCTKQQNGMNKKEYSNTSSKFKGVSWYPRHKKWVAYISFKRKRIFLGYFNSEEEAAKVRDVASKEFFGEFSPKLNL